MIIPLFSYLVSYYHKIIFHCSLLLSEQERILKQEKIFTSDKGNLCVFDPAGMHRGGICKTGTRIALQILMK